MQGLKLNHVSKKGPWLSITWNARCKQHTQVYLQGTATIQTNSVFCIQQHRLSYLRLLLNTHTQTKTFLYIRLTNN